MKKYSLCLTGLATLLLATTVSAVTVQLNGTSKNLSNFTITHTPEGITITSADMAFVDGTGGDGGTGDGGTGDGGTGDGGTGDGGTGDGGTGGGDTGGGGDGGDGDVGDCIESGTQRCGNPINWTSPGGRLTSAVSGTNVTLSWEFTTTSDPAYSGSVGISEVVGFEDVNRRLWISKAPNGEVLYPDYRCAAEGNSARNVSWSQQSNRFRCSLQPNTKYYINVKNTSGCSSVTSCGFYRSITTK